MAPFCREWHVVQYAGVDEVDELGASRLVADLHEPVGKGAVDAQPALVRTSFVGVDARQVLQHLHEDRCAAWCLMGKPCREVGDGRGAVVGEVHLREQGNGCK